MSLRQRMRFGRHSDEGPWRHTPTRVAMRPSSVTSSAPMKSFRAGLDAQKALPWRHQPKRVQERQLPPGGVRALLGGNLASLGPHNLRPKKHLLGPCLLGPRRAAWACSLRAGGSLALARRRLDSFFTLPTTSHRFKTLRKSPSSCTAARDLRVHSVTVLETFKGHSQIHCPLSLMYSTPLTTLVAGSSPVLSKGQTYSQERNTRSYMYRYCKLGVPPSWRACAKAKVLAACTSGGGRVSSGDRLHIRCGLHPRASH